MHSPHGHRSSSDGIHSDSRIKEDHFIIYMVITCIKVEDIKIISNPAGARQDQSSITHYYEIINACNALLKGLTRAEAEIDLNYAINIKLRSYIFCFG